MKTLSHLFILGFAGGLGTLARYGVGLGANAVFGPQHPWGTFIVNILGSFLFGLVSGLIAAEWFPEHWRIYLLTGFLGGFTTFSAFAFENQQFLSDRRWDMLGIHMLGQNVLGIIAVLLGLMVTECVMKKG